MKYLTCEQCDDKIEQTSIECVGYEGLYFCCRECLYAYVDFSSEPISERDFEMFGEDGEDGEEE